MGAEVRVEPALLDKAQQLCESMHAEVARDELGIDAVTEDAARGLAGWVMQRALGDMVWFWRDDLSKLGTYLDTFGNALHHAARAYRQSDQASQDLFDIRGR
jgi:hypothetical protein